jgi:hypothetical protein
VIRSCGGFSPLPCCGCIKTNAMKRKSEMDIELLNFFNEMYPDASTRNEAILNAKKAFSVIKQDVVYRDMISKSEYDEQQI